MAKRIKILFTIPNFDTAGSGRVVYDLVKGLDKTIFQPEICCFHNRGTYFKTIEQLGVKIHFFAFATNYRPFVSLLFRIMKIRKFFKKHQFDIIHSWHWSSDFTEPLAAKLAGIPYVYTKKAMSWGNRSWKWRSKLSTKIVTINSDMIQEFFSAMSNKVKQIPLGVDTDYFQPRLKPSETPDVESIKPDDFIIVSVANLVPVKGIEILLEAVHQLNDKRIKVYVVGNDQNDYAQRLKQQYTNENIVFLGKRMDVRPYLAMADVFVIPTKDEGRKEGMPIAPLEALAMGRIVIGSDIAGIKDILEPFKEHLFTSGNVTALVDKLEDIMNMDHISKTQLEARMRAHVEQNYRISNFVSHHQDLYKKLVW